MTTKQDSPTPEERRLEAIRESMDVLATLYPREQREDWKHPIHVVCAWIVREFRRHVATMEEYEPAEGDPCPVCSQIDLGDRVTECPGCGERTCERAVRKCHACMAPGMSDCPVCCTSEIRGTPQCRAKFWGTVPFVTD